MHSLQSMHLFPLTEIHLTVNWQNRQTALMSASLNHHLYVSITSVWYITGTEWYIYVASSPGSPPNQSVTSDPSLKNKIQNYRRLKVTHHMFIRGENLGTRLIFVFSTQWQLGHRNVQREKVPPYKVPAIC